MQSPWTEHSTAYSLAFGSQCVSHTVAVMRSATTLGLLGKVCAFSPRHRLISSIHPICMCFARAGTLLGGWAGEVALHRAAVHGLLLGLAQLGPPVTDALLRSPSWHALLGARRCRACFLPCSPQYGRNSSRAASNRPHYACS